MVARCTSVPLPARTSPCRLMVPFLSHLSGTRQPACSQGACSAAWPCSLPCWGEACGDPERLVPLGCSSNPGVSRAGRRGGCPGGSGDLFPSHTHVLTCTHTHDTAQPSQQALLPSFPGPLIPLTAPHHAFHLLMTLLQTRSFKLCFSSLILPLWKLRPRKRK